MTTIGRLPPLVPRWRVETPGCATRIHLNNAGAGLMPAAVLEAMRTHIEREGAIGGYEAADEARDDIAAAYEAVARLIGAAPHNVAVVENATVGFAQAVSAFDLVSGDAVVTTRNDYVSSQLLFLSLERRLGVDVLRADDLADGGVDPASVARLLDERPCKFVAVSWVPTNSGLVQPVEAVGAVCARAGVPLLVDACQAVGQIPVDVGALQCDFLCATARKFLRGPRGVGFLYVSDGALARGAFPLYPDMRGARWTGPDAFELQPDARRFENWEFNYAAVRGLGVAARYALSEDVAVTGARAMGLARYARERLAGIPGVRVLDRGTVQSAIVTVALDGWAGADAVARLREANINTSSIHREYAVLDMIEKGVESGVRLSPHYYNTADELDCAIEAIATLDASRP